MLDPIKDIFDWAVPILDNVPFIRAVIGIILVFFAPGFAWSLVIFKNINLLERLVLSFGLSVSLVVLSILGLNLVANVRITGLNALLIIILLTVIPLVIYYVLRYLRKRKERSAEEEA